MPRTAVSDHRSSNSCSDSGERMVPGVLLGVWAFCMACNPLVSHSNLLGFQNLTTRASFGDLAFLQWFGGARESWEVVSRLLPGLGHSFSTLNWVNSNLLSGKRWVAHVQSRAKGGQHYQTDTPVKTAQYKVSFQLYCICYYLMSVILSVSSFSPCSCCLCPSGNLSLAACLFLQPQHIWAPVAFCSAARPFFQVAYFAVASPSFPMCCDCLVQFFGDGTCFYATMDAKQISCLGGGECLGSVCADIVRTECKMCSSYMRLDTYCVSCFV